MGVWVCDTVVHSCDSCVGMACRLSGAPTALNHSKSRKDGSQEMVIMAVYVCVRVCRHCVVASRPRYPPLLPSP